MTGACIRCRVMTLIIRLRHTHPIKSLGTYRYQAGPAVKTKTVTRGGQGHTEFSCCMAGVWEGGFGSGVLALLGWGWGGWGWPQCLSAVGLCCGL